MLEWKDDNNNKVNWSISRLKTISIVNVHSDVLSEPERALLNYNLDCKLNIKNKFNNIKEITCKKLINLTSKSSIHVLIYKLLTYLHKQLEFLHIWDTYLLSAMIVDKLTFDSVIKLYLSENEFYGGRYENVEGQTQLKL